MVSHRGHVPVENCLNLSVSLAGQLLSGWLEEVNDSIEAAVPSYLRIYVIVGGSFVSGLATSGSDLDLCTLVDDRGSIVSLNRLELSFKQVTKSLDEKLQELGLHLCRLSRKIRLVSSFLQLERCRESRAAQMRATVRMHYLLSSRRIPLHCGNEVVQRRLGSEEEFLRLKRDLWRDYRRSLECTYLPVVSSLLRRPGSYSPGRVLRQVGVLVDNILLSSSGSKQTEAIRTLSLPLEQKLQLVMRPLTVGRGDERLALFGDSLREGLRLMRSAKEISMVQGAAYRRSFHYLATHGCISDCDWRRIEATVECLWHCMLTQAPQLTRNVQAGRGPSL